MRRRRLLGDKMREERRHKQESPKSSLRADPLFVLVSVLPGIISL